MKNTLFLFLLLCFISCGNNTEEQKAVKENVEQALEIVKELPALQKEEDAFEEALSQQKVTGSFEATMDNKALNINSWSGKKSSVHFLNRKAIFRLYTRDDRNEYVSVTIEKKDLFNHLNEKKFAPTMRVVDFSDTELLNQITEGYIQLAYYNKTTNEEYFSASGNMSLEKLSDTELQITFKGQAFKGDWKERNYVPFTASINLNYNFLKDSRSK
ncbi:hypothetical protein IMCC3317_10170 [Kordia antarctica]|uniref:Uncharacterized protein n=1 Tax=Kordia antarctica TaxID=1218801 RepID=A0A7L4ZGV1_9FLAO|nr:hypothetical protein [Kordia antarctica]QHI35671.1 hypothetical protein IMCC3317_10170 [Kordia antarctica]